MLLQSMAMVVMKLLGDDQVTPCVKKYVSWVLYVTFRIEKYRVVKHFAFLTNVCYQ